MLFEGMVQAFADLLAVTLEEAGWILGFVLVAVLVFSFLFMLSKKETGSIGFVMAGIGVAVAAGFGWWPPWSVIFIALIVVLVIVNPFGEGAGS
jgi:hypothetical protein